MVGFGLGAPEALGGGTEEGLDLFVEFVEADEGLLVAAGGGVGEGFLDELAGVHVVEVVVEGEIVAGADAGDGVGPVVEESGEAGGGDVRGAAAGLEIGLGGVGGRHLW